MVILAVILAVSAVTTVTVDLGPVLKGQAEKYASQYIERPLHIGRLSARLWGGRFIFEDLSIEGLTPQSPPFLFAKRITVSMVWNTLINKRVVFDNIEMSDWRMHTEVLANGGGHNFPRFTRPSSGGPRTWTVTLQYVRAHRGEFTFQDHGVPWSTIARNLEVIVARPTTEYRGQVRFSDGTVAIQHYVPMRADMTATFKADGGKLLFDRMDLVTDGARTALTGSADLGNFPEMTYQIASHINFPRMREIFFAKDRFSLHGEGDFTGTWHLFKGGRELTGSFTAPVLGVNDYRFSDVRGTLVWVPEKFEVTSGRGQLFGGHADFTYTMAPLGKRGVPAIATFDTTYRDVELTSFTNFLETRGLRLNGRASGHNVLAYPLGRFADVRGDGSIHVDAPNPERLLTRAVSAAAIDEGRREAAKLGPFSRQLPTAPVEIGGDIAYAFGPDWINIAPSRVATAHTFVEFQGRTAWGAESQIPFHVSSSDWQASDRLLAGILTAVGSPTQAIEIGGSGTFDGVMTESFTRPRIEGDFTGEGMRAWKVDWGAAKGHAVIENAYADVRNVVVTSRGATIEAEGRFSIGYPRRDGGEEINARVRVRGRPVSELRAAFDLYDYPIDGLLSGEFHIFGAYENPYGFGLMSIERGTAYEEPFDLATAALRFEGAGVRLDSLEIRKGAGRGVGAAYVGFDGTYQFNLDGRRIPVEQIALANMTASAPPLTGFLDFSAGGRGLFDDPSYDVKLSVSDLFVGDEGIGQLSGDVSLRGDVVSLRLEAASPRLAVSGAGRVELGESPSADVSFQVSDTSLDPYVRAFQPNFPPFTTAIAGGRIRVTGDPTNIQGLHVESEVDRLDISLFDYKLRNASPIRLTLDGDTLRVTEMRLAGLDTELDVNGVANLATQQIDARASGTANLGILQGFMNNVRGSGRASVAAVISGTATSPVLNGAMTVDNGRIRHFALPHALENINGIVQFDSRGIRLDGLAARLGGGDVTFGGRVDVEGYQPRAVDVSMTGRNMRLRFPEGMNSQADADLSLTGPVDAMLLGGNVLVRSAIYKRPLDVSGGILDLTGGGSALGSTPAVETLPLRYDVRINAPSTLRIENNTARISATADLQLQGTFERPLVFGRVDIDRGEVTFEAKRYVVTRGTIDFNNPARIEPFFDIQAETRIRVPRQTYQVTVNAAGTFDRLALQFDSDPPLPELEAIALLLGDVAPQLDADPSGTSSFSQYSTDITPQQQLLREYATRRLTGAVSEEVGRVVEQTFGVDTFQLTPSLGDVTGQSARVAPGARLTIGKRISDRVYLTYSRSLVSATRDQIILLEYDQSDRFSWVLSQNEDDTYALDVRVRHVF